MIIYDLARRAKHKIKEYQKSRDCTHVTPVRRIERVKLPAGKRVVAMTFDDGPTDIATNPKISENGLTLQLLETLEQYGARGTFDVIGTTEHNYPDEAGKHGSFTWGGVKFDHYPDINMDSHAGAKNRPELISRILSGGHEITNHGYRHILFGKMSIVYGDREYFKSVHEVIADIMELDRLLRDEYNYAMKLSRPPHYVDKIPDGKTSYDAYRYAGYNYLAASFDGGGWLPTGSFESDVEAMVEPLRRSLEENPDSLNGQIIFQKDGLSMARLSPVAAALPKQLELLKKYGYEVVTVSELLALNSFTDCINEDATALANAGYTVAYRNNTLMPERTMTFGELISMIIPPSDALTAYRELVDSEYALSDEQRRITKAYGIPENHPYLTAFCVAAKFGFIDGENSEKLSFKTPVTGEIFSKIIRELNPEYEFTVTSGTLSRKNAFSHLAAVLLK